MASSAHGAGSKFVILGITAFHLSTHGAALCCAVCTYLLRFVRACWRFAVSVLTLHRGDQLQRGAATTLKYESGAHGECSKSGRQPPFHQLKLAKRPFYRSC
eukprot:6177290-Pleurochrysis_carterae.AAC.3